MSSIKRILFPTDFSPSSRTAQAHFQELVNDLDAEPHVLFVAEEHSLAVPGLASVFATPTENLEQACHKAKSFLHKMFDSSWRKNGDLVTATRIGKPHREIVKYADEYKINLIIIGTHGHTGAFDILLGNVAENVLRHASCPVMTARPNVKS